MGLKFEGGMDIKGESKLKNLEDQLVLTSFQVGAVSHFSGFDSGGLGMGRTTMSEAVCTMYADKSVPNLFQAIGKHTEWDKVIVTLQRQSGDDPIPYMAYELEKASLTSWTTSVGGSNETMVSFSFAYKKLTVKYTPQNEDGSGGSELEGIYDQAAGT
jgi:type VI secretion system Hcp family effector